MGRLSFVADEHVPRVFTHALGSSGFDVTTAQERYGQESVDRSILVGSTDEGRIVLTNDRDFVRIADDHDHAGILMYTDRRFLVDQPTAAVEAIGRIDRHYTTDEIRNRVEWLDNWR